MKIMVVDDEPDVKLLFAQKFRKEIKNGELTIIFAFSAEEAIDKLQHQEGECIVLILSDINMPGMNGLELLKVIKSNWQQLKVFMITAYGDEINRQLALENGADDYLNKPVDFAQLKSKICNLS